jgi:hypothetical protein
VGRHSGPDDSSPGGMTEHLSALLTPPTAGPTPIQDLTSVLHDPAQHFQLDVDQAPKAIAAFRQAAAELRDLAYTATGLGQVSPPGHDAVSIDAAKVIGQWADGGPSSLRGVLESGATELERVADALERSLAVHQNTDETNSSMLSRRQL